MRDRRLLHHIARRSARRNRPQLMHGRGREHRPCRLKHYAIQRTAEFVVRRLSSEPPEDTMPRIFVWSRGRLPIRRDRGDRSMLSNLSDRT